MAVINNLFNRFARELFRITLTAYGHLSFHDSEVSVKPVEIQFYSHWPSPSFCSCYQLVAVEDILGNNRII